MNQTGRSPQRRPQPGTNESQPKNAASIRKKRQENFRRQLLFFALCCVCFTCIVCLTAAMLSGIVKKPDTNSSVVPPVSSAPEPVPQPVVQTVRFSASGDNLIHDGLYLQAKARGQNSEYDFAALYENVAAFYKDFDVNWINQETLLTDEFEPSGYPMFCSPTAVGKALYDIGFRVFALSNNHSYDKGAAGIASSLAFWDTMPEDVLSPGFYAGESDYTNIQTHTVNGITIAYLPYTEHTNGLPTPSGATANIIYTSQTDVIEQQIRHARTIADIVIPTVHWGTEDSHKVNDAQRILAQQMADWGADVVIGTHPHVVQPVETITAAESGKQVPVFYSLGNFVSLQSKTPNLMGAVGTFSITKTTQPDGAISTEITDVQTHPLVMHYQNGYKNGRVYWEQDYTDELIATHGNREITRESIAHAFSHLFPSQTATT